MTTLFLERFANEHQVELCIDKIDNKICLFHFTGQGDDRKCDITRWGLNSHEMMIACQRFEETCAQEYQIQLDAQLAEMDGQVKANTLVKGDKFKIGETVCILQYDAYYPDPYGKEVALIFQREGSYVTENTRIHGQDLIEIIK